MTILHIVQGLARHPIRRVFARWNWKAAVLSTSIRGAIFFTTNLPAGLNAAMRALAVDVVFRLPLVGVYAAVTQAFEGGEPVWAAYLTAMLLVPALAHAIEFLVHWVARTPELRTSVLVSIAFSMISTVFNLFAMRRGVLVAGDEARSLWEDLRRLPLVVVEFVWAGVVAMRRIVPGVSRHTTARDRTERP